MDIKIFLAGDSAGGNLCLSLLSHISHPHPDLSIPRVDLKGEKLRGTLLISPWVTFDTSAPSIFSNRETDYLLPESLKRASKAFLGDAKEDAYNTPLGASVEWWEDLHIQDLGIIVSDSELFFSDIIAFSEKIKVRKAVFIFSLLFSMLTTEVGAQSPYAGIGCSKGSACAVRLR